MGLGWNSWWWCIKLEVWTKSANRHQWGSNGWRSKRRSYLCWRIHWRLQQCHYLSLATYCCTMGSHSLKNGHSEILAFSISCARWGGWLPTCLTIKGYYKLYTNWENPWPSFWHFGEAHTICNFTFSPQNFLGCPFLPLFNLNLLPTTFNQAVT